MGSYIQYLWFIFFLDFNHSCIETVKINGVEIMNALIWDLIFPTVLKLGPESNSRLRPAKMAKFSDILPGEREGKEYLIKTILNSVDW